jgi:hypothetical protein
MARMTPPSAAHDSSSAELWMFKKLEKLSDQYRVLHSLGSMRHDHKNWSEIDFTIVGPEGIFLIEVKGGTVGRKNGAWEVQRGDGKMESLGRGPFFQVGGAEAATRKFLQNRFSWINEIVMGYWVVTPDCVLNIDDLGVDSRALYDANNLHITAEGLVQNMRQYWMHRNHKNGALDADQINKIVNSLCADVPMIKSLRREIDQVSKLIYAATIEQEKVLGAAKSNARLLIKGPAGSGKSTLAIHEIDRQLMIDKSILYSCSSKAMSQRIASIYFEESRVKVLTTEQLLERPQSYDKKWDVLIIDEAQDLQMGPLFSVYDNLLHGGVANGTWRMFLDPFQSVIYDGESLESQFSISGNPFRLELLDNVRTTTQIAATASALGYVNQMNGGINGPDVFLDYGARDEISVKVRKRIDLLVSLGLNRSEILLLSLDRHDFSNDSQLRDIVAPLTSELRTDLVRYSTVADAKGLESVAVILFGFSEFESFFARQQAYIGATRASTYLSVILDRKVEPDVVAAYVQLVSRH